MLAYVDVSINKTKKSKLMHKLEERVKGRTPSTSDTCIIDTKFLIRTLINVPNTYGDIAKFIPSRSLAFRKRVDFVCDSYKNPSIKDIEHGIRGSGCKPTSNKFIISGPEQKRPSDFNAALNSANFKVELNGTEHLIQSSSVVIPS